jgi:hypothetical protein
LGSDARRPPTLLTTVSHHTGDRVFQLVGGEVVGEACKNCVELFHFGHWIFQVKALKGAGQTVTAKSTLQLSNACRRRLHENYDGS